MKNIDALLRERLDPGRKLPRIRLTSQRTETNSGITAYRAFADLRVIGSIMLRRSIPEVGLGTVIIDQLRIGHDDRDRRLRQATELAILVKSSIEQRVIVSDMYGVSAEESAMWNRFAGADVATIVTPFVEREVLFHGESVYDGRAFALPVRPTSIG